MNAEKVHPQVLLIWGLWMLWAFGLQTFFIFLNTEVDGVIVSSRDIPRNRGPRYATEYTLRAPDGHEFAYVSGPTDATLPRSMPVGTRLKKERWHLSYERDGQRENGSFPFFYATVIGIGFTSVGCSFALWRRQRQMSQLMKHTSATT